MRFSVRFLFCLCSSVLLAVFLVFSPAIAQTQSIATLNGVITDPRGAVISGAQISVEQVPSTGEPGRAVSGSEGRFSMTLTPGRYRVVIARDSFGRVEEEIAIAAGEIRELRVNMTLEPLSSKVIVTAEAEPTLAEQATAPVSILTKDEIQQRQLVGLADALNTETGIAIARTGPEGGTASVFLNGGNSNFTKVLVDGAPINPPGGPVDFSSLTLDNIDKVEIVRGAESAIYGTDAVSGVIQLFTHRGDTRTPEFSVYGEGGNFDSGRGGAQFSGLLGAFDYSAAASYFSADGQGPNDSFLNRTFSGNFGYTLGDNDSLRLTLRDNDSSAGIPGETIFEPPSLYQRYRQHLFSSSGLWDFSTGKHWHHQISGAESYTWQDTNNPLQSFYATDPYAFCPQTNPSAVPTLEFCDYTGDTRYQYNRANVTAQTSYSVSSFGVTAGYEYEVENAFLSSTDVPHARRNNQAGFLDFRYRPHPRVSLNFGGRAEANANFGTRVVPRAGASLHVLDVKGWRGDTFVRAFYSEGIKEPRFDQIYGDNFGDFGNPSLKPEASKTWTTGIEQKFLADRVRIEADYFYNLFYNIVSFEFCTSMNNFCNNALPGQTMDFGYYFNTDRARARGVNLTGEGRFTHWLNLAGNYNYDDSRVLAAPNAFDQSEIPGNRLLRRPVNSGNLTLNAAFKRMNWNLAGYFTGRRTDSDFLGLGLNSNPGYARFDLAGSYDLGHGVSFYGRIANLTDKQYQEVLGFPALGREFRIGMKYTTHHE